jgi:hypothetical protein
LLIAAGIAGMVPASRAAFEHAPAALDLQQRGRTLVDTIASAVRSAGVPGFVPAVVLADPDSSGESFSGLLAIVRRPGGAEGVLDRDQAGASGALVLSHAGCPDVEDVCGFVSGATAVIADGAGRFDLFIVQDARPPARERIGVFRRLSGGIDRGGSRGRHIPARDPTEWIEHAGSRHAGGRRSTGRRSCSRAVVSAFGAAARRCGGPGPRNGGRPCAARRRRVAASHDRTTIFMRNGS